jgi:hypothetical protein
MSHPIHTYTELQQQIHDDLRIQHPEWVKPNGESPKCDSYETCLTNARHFDAKEIQRVYRSSGWRIGTGSNWKLKTYGIRFKASWSYSYSVWG